MFNLCDIALLALKSHSKSIFPHVTYDVVINDIANFKFTLGKPKSPNAKSPPTSPLPNGTESPVQPSSPEVAQTNGEVNGTIELTEDQIIEQKRALMMKGMLRSKKKSSPRPE